MRELAELVAEHPLLAGLPGDAVTRVAGCARNVTFGAGDLLLAEGDAADTFYLVRRGRVAIEVHAPGRGPIMIETVGPGGTVGWSWLVPPYRWQFDARAMVPVGAIAVDGACLRDKAEVDPVLGYALMTRVVAVLLERLQMTRVRLLDLYGAGGGAG
ncbi:MAG TPA: cyclic nucleotide-binding domain-containing protein [Acidimicrobiales bacterium]|nr:cyclic nucleotide-binding domain-containing protein [Acidimicrobiales bacterium]